MKGLRVCRIRSTAAAFALNVPQIVSQIGAFVSDGTRKKLEFDAMDKIHRSIV